MAYFDFCCDFYTSKTYATGRDLCLTGPEPHRGAARLLKCVIRMYIACKVSRKIINNRLKRGSGAELSILLYGPDPQHFGKITQF
jgi:hypothetical protein